MSLSHSSISRIALAHSTETNKPKNSTKTAQILLINQEGELNKTEQEEINHLCMLYCSTGIICVLFKDKKE